MMTIPVAVVTGASSGIGLAIAERLARRNPVAMISRSTSRLAAAKESIESGNSAARLELVEADVRSTTSVSEAIDHIVTRFGDPSILVNCAGIGGGGITSEFSGDQWTEIINTNLTGTFLVTAEILRRSQMTHKGWGRIINIASTGGKQGVVYAAAYSASKHAVVGFSKSLGLELAKTGITVNAVCPGFVETEMAVRARLGYNRIWDCTPEEAKTRIEQRIPLGRYVTADEVASVVEFLAGTESAPILAQAINVCGGLGNY